MAKNTFRGMPGGMNQAAMMKKAQQMQQQTIQRYIINGINLLPASTMQVLKITYKI